MLTLIPGKQDGHLESGHIQIVAPEVIHKGDSAIAHVMVPLQLTAGMLLLVKLLHIRNIVLELDGQ